MADMDIDKDRRGFKLFGTRIPMEAGQVKEIGEEAKPEKRTTAAAGTILPCPRCKSMETKFCYFNNYNVNQPRHFCKGCQRYWTAGGALRNVPVGAGRRKARPSSSSREDCVLECSPAGMEEEEGVVVVEQWVLNRDFPTKRPNNGLTNRIR